MLVPRHVTKIDHDHMPLRCERQFLKLWLLYFIPPCSLGGRGGSLRRPSTEAAAKAGDVGRSGGEAAEEEAVGFHVVEFESQKKIQ